MRGADVLRIYLACGLAATVVLLGYQPAGGADVRTEVARLNREKGWVIVWNRLEGSPARAEVFVRVGDQQRPLSLVHSGAVAMGGQPTVSRSGEKVAFLRMIHSSGQPTSRWRVAVVDVDGSNYTEFGDLASVPSGPQLALSPDHRWLAMIEGRELGPQRLLVLRVSGNPGEPVFARPLTISPGHPHPPLRGWSFADLTSQAWAPDNRRLVYVNADGRMTIVDVPTGVDEDLGPGVRPTWSRNGTRIAYHRTHTKQRGDYFLVSAVPPRQPTRILANRSAFLSGRESQGYVGPALWSPDDRFLLILRLMSGDYEHPYILDLATGQVEALPEDSMGNMNSWGGKP